MKSTRSPDEARDASIQIRATPTESRDLRRRADRLKMTLTSYLIGCGLGEIDPSGDDLFGQVRELHQRVERCERLLDLGGLD